MACLLARASFPDLKGQAPLRRGGVESEDGEGLVLFLTSKVRLHCDHRGPRGRDPRTSTFPDLKGQAPLRLAVVCINGGGVPPLFLTSKVRLHCDGIPGSLTLGIELFLTSKVRLHCDQALAVAAGKQRALFLTSKVRLHCDPGRGRTVAAPWSRFS